MTKNEITQNLILICQNKINESKIINSSKLDIYDAILKILKIPNFYDKQDIEVTINILKDLDIEEEYMAEIVKIFMN